MKKQNKSSIRNWMLEHIEEFIDENTGEVNCTDMVEGWDREISDGEQTLNPDHIAWDIAVEVEKFFVKEQKSLSKSSIELL